MPRIVVRLTAFDDQNNGIAMSSFTIGEVITDRMITSIEALTGVAPENAFQTRYRTLVERAAQRFREMVSNLDMELYNERQNILNEVSQVFIAPQIDWSIHQEPVDVGEMQDQIHSLVDEQRRLREARTRFSMVENAPPNFQAQVSEVGYLDEPTDMVLECAAVGTILGLPQHDAISVLTSTYCSICRNAGCTASNSRGPQPGDVRQESELPSWLETGMTDGIASMTRAEGHQRLAFLRARPQLAPEREASTPPQPLTRFERKPVI